jgi:hypothetical protein
LILPPRLGGRARHSVRAADVHNESDSRCFGAVGGAHGVTRTTLVARDQRAAVSKCTRAGVDRLPMNDRMTASESERY